MIAISFGEFSWQVNPTELTVQYERETSERVLPGKGALLGASGRKLRKVSGKGCFAGAERGEQFASLEELFLGGAAKTLILPGIRPFSASFTALEEVQLGGDELITYRFTFLETAAREEKILPESILTEAEGESLWEIAYRWGREIEALAEKNRHLPNIGWIGKGERIWL